MRLQELKEQVTFLKNKMEIQKWLSKNCIGLGDYTIHPNGIVDVSGSVALSPYVTTIDVQFGIVNGDLITQVTDAIPPNLTNLHGAPLNVETIDVSNASRIKSLEGVGACDNIIAYDTGITRIEDVFPHLSKEKGLIKLDISGCNITSLIGVNEMVTAPIKKLGLTFDVINEGGIGLLLIPGLEIIGAPGFNETLPPAFEIIKKYLGRPNDIYACQAELLDAGYEDIARL